jgi:hypothetical protein
VLLELRPNRFELLAQTARLRLGLRQCADPRLHLSGTRIEPIDMLVGIGFLSVLTATIASHFLKTDRGTETTEIMATLKRVEAELADSALNVRRPFADLLARSYRPYSSAARGVRGGVPCGKRR